MYDLIREKEAESTERVLLGTIDGRVGLLNLQGNRTLRITWLINSMGSEITCLDTFELQDGLDILIGRQDGIVEVFTFPDEDTSASLRYRYVNVKYLLIWYYVIYLHVIEGKKFIFYRTLAKVLALLLEESLVPLVIPKYLLPLIPVEYLA